MTLTKHKIKLHFVDLETEEEEEEGDEITNKRYCYINFMCCTYLFIK